MTPGVTRLLESAIYVDDIRRSADFYIDLFGFPVLVRDDRRICALDVTGEQVFLLFRKGETRNPVITEGGIIPPHDGEGEMHFAFGIDASTYEEWKSRLNGRNIAIESEVRWPHGGRSIYFRDPDNNCVELATRGTWATY
jgi:catechol 2,3-dioxygenase-like lactoylglutathione lyase family enzyme